MGPGEPKGVSEEHKFEYIDEENNVEVKVLRKVVILRTDSYS